MADDDDARQEEPEGPPIDRGDPDAEQEEPPPTPAQIGLPPPD